jgi:hypothetical protein
MRRGLLCSTVGLWLALGGSPAGADEWRAAGTPAPAAARAAPLGAPQPVKRDLSAAGMQLGRPVAVKSPFAAAPEPKPASAPAESVVRTSYTPPRTGGPAGLTVRAQSPGGMPPVFAAPGVPLSPEEQYNCGVVTEGPAVGHPVFAGPRQWFGGLFAGSTPPAWADWFGIRGTFESDHEFDIAGFISPVSNPFFFEDPRALTELRPIFIYQKTPSSNPLFRGGDIEFYALQARLALSERLSFNIHKLGFVSIQPDGIGPLGPHDETGFAEIMLGPKYTFWRGVDTDTIAAFGLNFEIASGSDKVFQGTGGGGVTPYLSFAQRFAQDFHFMATAGYRFGFSDARSDLFFTSLHLDYNLFNVVFPLVEMNWYHYTNSGKTRNFDFEGGDLFNFGSSGVEGNDFLSLALGVRVKIAGEAVQTGFIVEFPLLERDDLMDYRIQADLIFRY